MKFLRTLVIVSPLAFLPYIATAANCDCQKHKAGASGTGSCSLSEDDARCSISYSTTSSSSLEGARRAAEKFGSQLPIEMTFDQFNQVRPEQMRDSEAFRSLFINTLFLSGGDSTAAEQIINELQIQSRVAPYNFTFENLFEDFKKYGCIEYSYRRTRFLLISRFSDFNGSCR